MSNNSLLNEFGVHKKEIVSTSVKDYEVFPDKERLDELRTKIVQNLINNKIPQNVSLEQYINDEIDETLQDYDLSAMERNHIFNLIQNEINGYGPLTDLLNNDTVTEIMVNGINDIYVEIDGKLVKDESVSFINETHIIRTIQRIVQPLGRTIDATNPMVDARLKDGSRLNAIIPPLSLTGPVITIRKFSKRMEDIDDLLRMGTMTAHMAMFLEACVKAKLNIIISGGTGSGKTTLLNILSGFIDDDERIITIEDAAELKVYGIENLVRLEVRNKSLEGSGEVTIRDLIKTALRMRPDRIIVGEVRGAETIDMLQAMNTGHDGSLSTGHGNSVSDMLDRLETMVLLGTDIPLMAVRKQIASAIDIMVQLGRLRDGRRCVLEISEILSCREGEIEKNPIYVFQEKEEEEIGELKRTKSVFIQQMKLRRAGFKEMD